MKYSTKTPVFSYFRHSEGALATSLNHRDERRGTSSDKLPPRRRPGSSRKLLWIPAYASMTNGFSLVELSIVLVILGLLTGGILTGQNLIRNAELRSVTTEIQRYQAAVYTFRDKYMALPGDMTNATDFWGTDPDGCPGDESDTSMTEATCNGNGDGKIHWYINATTGGESHRFWQHLANAGLIEGSFTGTQSGGSCGGGIPGSCNVTLGVNAPASRLSSAGWSISHLGDVASGHGYYFESNYGNVLFFGAVSNWTTAAVLEPEEAWNIDKKVDDGKPGTGKVLPWNNTYNASCTDSDTPSTASYRLDISGTHCQLVVKTGF